MSESKKSQKFAELLVYIVKNFSNGNLTETKLWKLLYFCDADFFEKNRETITEVDYFKNNYGATPDKKIIESVLPKLKKFIKIEKITKDDGRKITVFSPIEDSDFEYKFITANEIESAKETCKQYFNLSVNDVCVLAHKDPPYLGAKMRERINFSFVDYRDRDAEIAEEKECGYKGTISDEAAGKLLAYVG